MPLKTSISLRYATPVGNYTNECGHNKNMMTTLLLLNVMLGYNNKF